MSQATNPDKPFWLRDNFAPTPDEVSTSSLEVVGTIPADLRGRYLRTGPNPMSGPTEHWFLGDGMIHGIELAGGEADGSELLHRRLAVVRERSTTALFFALRSTRAPYLKRLGLKQNVLGPSPPSDLSTVEFWIR